MYLYHFVPDNQTGDTLYPLNELKKVNPELYKKHFSKYKNLKEKDVKIPGFGHWNDCLNFIPVNPKLVKSELEKFGHNTDWTWRFYKIDANTLDNDKLILMVPEDKEDALKRGFLPFNEENFKKYCKITDIARHRYKNAKDNSETPFTFGGITHALYKNSLPTNNLEVVEID